MAVQAGSKAPAFSMKDQAGRTVQLSDFAGQHVVLYFYPKDNTPGCTQEACDFRDEYTVLQRHGAVVLGVSPDSEASHAKFAGKYNLSFPLLVDEGHRVADTYGAWGEKSLYGRKFMGLIRSTFLIDPEGRVKKAWPKVKVGGHVHEVLAALQGRAPATSEPASVKPRAGGSTVGKVTSLAKKLTATVAKKVTQKRSAAAPKKRPKPAVRKKTGRR